VDRRCRACRSPFALSLPMSLDPNQELVSLQQRLTMPPGPET
jgi:hypothetical protein